MFEQAKNSLRKFQSRDKLFADESDSKMVVKKEEALSAEAKEVLVSQGWKPPPEGEKKKNYSLKGVVQTCHRCDSENHSIANCPKPVGYKKPAKEAPAKKKPPNNDSNKS